MKRNVITILIIINAAACVILGGCVERIIKITTEPAGSLVWLNDQEVGQTPLEVPFTWYGQYEVVIRKQGYQTLKTSRKTPVPFYQRLGIDFISEVLLPWKIRDRHEWHYKLDPREPVNTDELIQRADSLRK